MRGCEGERKRGRERRIRPQGPKTATIIKKDLDKAPVLHSKSTRPLLKQKKKEYAASCSSDGLFHQATIPVAVNQLHANNGEYSQEGMLI